LDQRPANTASGGGIPLAAQKRCQELHRSFPATAFAGHVHPVPSYVVPMMLPHHEKGMGTKKVLQLIGTCRYNGVDCTIWINLFGHVELLQVY